MMKNPQGAGGQLGQSGMTSGSSGFRGSIVRHGALDEFRGGSENVEDYMERFLLYCAANGVAEGEDNVERRKVFFMSVGVTTYGLLKNLVRPGKPQDSTLKGIGGPVKESFSAEEDRYC